MPIAAYLGVAYSTYEHRWLPVAGLNVSFTRNLSGTVIFDGVRVHPLINYSLGPHAFSFVLALRISRDSATAFHFDDAASRFFSRR